MQRCGFKLGNRNAALDIRVVVNSGPVATDRVDLQLFLADVETGDPLFLLAHVPLGPPAAGGQSIVIQDTAHGPIIGYSSLKIARLLLKCDATLDPGTDVDIFARISVTLGGAPYQSPEQIVMPGQDINWYFTE